MPADRVSRSALGPLRLAFDAHAEVSRLQRVREGVDLHNVAATGLPEYFPLALFLEAADGEVMGGVLGQLWGGWLHVTFVWVDRRARGRGHARRLIAAAERWALERGAIGVHLESFSFQAPGLYRKLGYEEFGVIDDFPPGHRQHFFRKRLAPTTGASRERSRARRGEARRGSRAPGARRAR
ncbi:MAG TPA: GNAT family N-acetyltransferase [Candidatus Binatia bacterium]|nr:GNAT family N-acetyltransferase [Candidatus Binatia bacterium]